jgi:hypothetical protein
MNSKQKNVIGLGGVARSGKDTFAAILEMKLQQAGKTVKKIALAGPLKSHCDKFLSDNLGVSAFTQIPEEKILIRPFLVWYGDAQRKRTNGKFWTNLASQEIKNTDAEYCIITDIRYDFYQVDELQWVKDEWKGTLCHISKYVWRKEVEVSPTELGKVKLKDYVQPANEHEQINDPKIKNAAHYCIEWPHVDDIKPENLLFDPILNEYVDSFIEDCKIL